jgi:polyhydroxyalkanoate synthesis regulator phasin
MSEAQVNPEQVEVVEDAPKAERSPLYEAVRKVLLAGVGVIVITRDELENFTSRLVERGEMAEKDARQLLREVMERREKLENEREAARSRRASSQLATRAEIAELTQRVAELTQQLEELRKSARSD